MTLSIPDFDDDVDMLTAALAYADAGLYVLPVARIDRVSPGKNPGSVVGKNWHDKSSRDPKQLAAWFAATDHGIALHCGRSGVVVFDVDNPNLLPDVLRRHLAAALFQSSRPDVPGRGHYVFLQPPGRTIGNSTGRLGGAWGEVRGLNGVIIAEPSWHPEGGEYSWIRTGPVQVLLDEIADLLDDANPASDAATDAAVAEFLAQHRGTARPQLLLGPVQKLEADIAEGKSRHTSATSAAVWATDESRAGYYSAEDAAAAIREIFINALATQRDPSDRVVTGEAAVSEWDGILAWSVGQTNAKTDDQINARRARIDANAPISLEDYAMNKAKAAVTHAESETQASDGSSALKPVAPADTPPAGQPKPKLRLIKASSIPITLPEWVWAYGDHGRISRSALTLFAGRPGAGKSTCARWFAAGWSRGTLSGCWEGQPVNGLYIATEEHWQSVVAPSLQAAGADMDRVLFLARGDDPARIKSVDDETELTELLVDNDIRVVCLDPLMSTLTSGADLYKSNEVREALDPWVRIAEKIDGVVLGVAHMVKSAQSGDVVAAINGSSAFGEVARCVFGFAVDRQAEDGTRVMSQGKNSAGYDGLNLAYSIESAPIVAADGRRGEVARFVMGDPTDTSVSDLMLAEGKQKRPMSAGQFLEAWFDTHPETEWIPVTDIVSAGERFGHTEDALARARDRRGYQTGKDALHWYWGTPDAAPLDAADTGGAHRGGHGRFTSRRPA